MLLLSNADVERVLTIEGCVGAIEDVYAELATGDAVGVPRIDMYTPSGRDEAPFHRWGVMAGASRGLGYACARLKSDMVAWPTVDGRRRETKWTREPGTFCGFILLFSTGTGEPLALMSDGVAQHLRVGAAAGVGAKHLARSDAAVVGMIGSGGMARSYLAALCSVRPIRTVRVYSPTTAHREAYALEMARRHGVEVVAVDDARSAVRGADIVALCVSSLEQVFDPAWLEPGMHVADVTRASTPPDFPRAVDRAFWHGNPTPLLERLPADAMYARGGYLSWVAGGPEAIDRIPRMPPNLDLLRLPTLADLLGGRATGRTADRETTFFHNVGNVGAQFAAVSGLAYQNAVAAGIGAHIPTEWFLEDVRD
jgi:ornithine cyclodeaminase/alanine dehydrogenase-like protein (mu-crystallin family)